MIKRFILNKLVHEISQPEINILLGPRQVGKTTILKMLQKHIEQQGYKTFFFDLEQPLELAQFNIPDHEVISKIKQSGDFIFIDEFQYIENASKVFKAIYDSNFKIKLICSGSSSIEIHRHLKESLAGRKFIFKINPLELAELRLQDKNYSLESYLVYGGMPGLTHTPSEERKMLILNELLSTYIQKDIKALIKEKNIRAFNHLLYLLAQNQGSLISIHSLAGEINLSSKTVNKYMDILEATYVNYRIYSYSRNLGNELKKSCKTYFYDPGIRNSILRDFSSLSTRSDKGVLYETYVFLKLNSDLKPNMELKFWRTKDGAEVDFILLKNRTPIPIEVKSNLTNTSIPGGMKKFLSRYTDVPEAYIINENISQTESHHKTKINFITYEQFNNLIF